MSTLDKTLFITIMIICFWAGQLSVPFQETMILNEYEAEIEHLVKERKYLEDFIMLREGQ